MILAGVEFVNRNASILKKPSEFLLPSEIEYCRRYKDADIHIAGCLAAKLAIIKTMSDISPVFPEDFEVKHNKSGKPFVFFLKKELEKYTLSISISHTKTLAVCLCVIKNGHIHSSRKKKRYT